MARKRSEEEYDPKEIIKAEATIDLICEKFNCREAEIDARGNVWIADPQRGHWLNEDQERALVEWLLIQQG